MKIKDAGNMVGGIHSMARSSRKAGTRSKVRRAKLKSLIGKKKSKMSGMPKMPRARKFGAKLPIARQFGGY